MSEPSHNRDPFADDVLERLIASNMDYQRSHGHYIVPLAERLLTCRRELARYREREKLGEPAERQATKETT